MEPPPPWEIVQPLGKEGECPARIGSCLRSGELQDAWTGNQFPLRGRTVERFLGKGWGEAVRSAETTGTLCVSRVACLLFLPASRYYYLNAETGKKSFSKPDLSD